MTTAQIVAEDGHQVVHLPSEIRLEGTEVIVKRIGEAVLLLPRDADRWAMLTNSLEQFTNDFMDCRAQPANQDRDLQIE